MDIESTTQIYKYIGNIAMGKNRYFRRLKRRSSVALFVCSLVFATAAYSLPNCGSGEIVAIKEGGWETGHLMVKIDYSVSSQLLSYKGTEWYGWVRYKNNLDEDRFAGIRSLIYIAFAKGSSVEISSHTGRCDNATEFTII